MTEEDRREAEKMEIWEMAEKGKEDMRDDRGERR
jgi:hypothetical protein